MSRPDAPDRRRLLAAAAATKTKKKVKEEDEDVTPAEDLMRERCVVSRHEYDALGEEFQKKEHQLLGQDGFEGVVEEIAALEKRLGIYDLEQFTPR